MNGKITKAKMNNLGMLNISVIKFQEKIRDSGMR